MVARAYAERLHLRRSKAPRRRPAGGRATAAEARAARDRSSVQGSLLELQRKYGNGYVGQLLRRIDTKPDPEAKEASARFEGDGTLQSVSSGAATLVLGATGLPVTRLQQALVDLHCLPPGAATGTFDAATKTALAKFQKDKGITDNGELNAATLAALNAVYDTRKPYIDNATYDPAHPGTHALSAADQAAAIGALVPAAVPGAPSSFKEDLTSPARKYGPRMEARLKDVIAKAHKRLFEDKEPLRVDPAKNFHDWSTLEGPAAAAKKVVDDVYASNYGGSAAKPPMTHAGGNLIDQWEDEVATNVGLTDAEKKAKATSKVWYLAINNCDEVNGEHSAVPSASKEKAILAPIIDSLVDDQPKVQRMLELDIGWPGAQLAGHVYLQRFKSTDPDKDKAKEANRVQMWSLFHTCIHEYLHTLAHTDFNTWARSFKAAGDDTRYSTLTEGFCEFFTLNVRSVVAPAAVQAQVEGPYANGQPPPTVHPGVYGSNAQAEQVVAIVGIKNAQRAYFGGETKLIGKT